MKITRYSCYFLLFLTLVGIWATLNANHFLTSEMAYEITKDYTYYVKDEPTIWENPLINGLFIPLGLYFGKKVIDFVFFKLQKEGE